LLNNLPELTEHIGSKFQRPRITRTNDTIQRSGPSVVKYRVSPVQQKQSAPEIQSSNRGVPVITNSDVDMWLIQ